MRDDDFYVYVYIDPRNYQEFYCGKGRGKRYRAHLRDVNDSKKSRRIDRIKEAGVEPIVRVVAANLTEAQAFIVESTLIWKTEGRLTNQVAGHFAKHFRPARTMHRELPGFEFANKPYHVNVASGL